MKNRAEKSNKIWVGGEVKGPNKIWVTGRRDAIFFCMLLAGYTAATLYLFIMQCHQVPDFVSDMPDYVSEVAGIKGNYEFPYPLFFMVGKFFALFAGAETGTAIATAFLNSLGVCVAKFYMDRLILKQDILNGKDTLRGMISTAAVFALFLLGNLYSPKNTAFFGFDYAYRCMGIYTPNPIWNATYMATRPFAVICFFEGCRMVTLVGKGSFEIKDALWFGIGLFLTTVTKPSFTMVIVPAMGIILLVQLVCTRFKRFKDAFMLCLTMLPTLIALLYQFFGVFTGTNSHGEETGIGIAFAKVWSNYSTNIPLSIVMGMALPIGVLVLNIKELKKNPCFGFAWANYLVSMLMFLLFYEKGFRMLHANFSWGYMHGMFFVFMVTLVLVIKNTVRWFKTKKFIFVLAEWGVLLFHLVCGVNFFVYALQGKELAGF